MVLLGSFQARRQGWHPLICSLEGRAHRARPGHARADILAKVDARHAQCRPAGDYLQQRVEDCLGGRAMHAIGRHMLPVDLILHSVDRAIVRGRQAASRPRLLGTRRRYNDVAQRQHRAHSGAQARRFNAIVTGHQDQRRFHTYHKDCLPNQDAVRLYQIFCVRAPRAGRIG